MSTWELVLFAVGFVAVFGLAVLFATKDRKYLRSPTREALSPSLREEIEREREASLARQKRFNEAMEHASKR